MTIDFDLDGVRASARNSDSILTAAMRAGLWPAGPLCDAGDCPNCLATIDGRPHVRMCQTPALEGMVVLPTPVSLNPPLPSSDQRPVVEYRHVETDAVIIGGGRSGSEAAERLAAAGQETVVLEAKVGAEALAVYRGPEVLARVDGELVRYRCSRVIVATGRAEIQPVIPGSQLRGVLTPRAAIAAAAAGVDLGTVVIVGTGQYDIEGQVISGPAISIEGVDRVTGVRTADGVTTPCDTVVIDLGFYPRDLLARMAQDATLETIGGAAEEGRLPSCPEAGVVCPCSGVTVADLDDVHSRGFDEIELIKRATLAGTGTCQGLVCTPYLRSFVLSRGGVLQPTFTARPLARQMTLAEAAAGYRLAPIHRTGLDDVHRELGARMDRIGGWLRPWTYPDPEQEYWSVRTGVSLCDVGTLGKMIVSGPDSAEFLDRLYPCHVTDIRHGRSRYALLLAESGGLMDDGLISRVDETTFHLSFTSGGASHAEAWVRDWAHGFGADVRIMDRTHSLGAINVTGPRATELLARIGLDEEMRFMSHGRRTIADVPCHVYRLSFTGEVSYELHHPIRHSGQLWQALMAAGADMDIAPHGLQTLQTLRLEKGHIIIGMDTEPDSTPRRLGMDWAVKMEKDDFVGRPALERTDRFPVRKRLLGFEIDGPAPVDGTPLSTGNGLGGYITSAAWSPVLEKSVMLGWVDLDGGDAPDEVMIGEQTARTVPTPFYDPGGDRARA